MKKAILLLAITCLFINGVYGQEQNHKTLQQNLAFKLSSFSPKYLSYFKSDEMKYGYGLEYQLAKPIKSSPINIKLYTELSLINTVRRDFELYYFTPTKIEHIEHKTLITILNATAGLGVHYVKRVDKDFEIDFGVNAKLMLLAQVSPLNADPFTDFGPDEYEAKSNFTTRDYKPYTLGATVGINYYPFKNPNKGISFSYNMDQLFSKNKQGLILHNVKRHSLSIGYVQNI